MFPRLTKQSKEHAVGGTQAEILSALLPKKAGSEVKGEKSSQVLENEIPPHQMAWSSSVSQFSSRLVKKSTVTFRAFTWEVTSLNRQVLSFSSSRCHAGDRWKKIPGTPQRSKTDSQSL